MKPEIIIIIVGVVVLLLVCIGTVTGLYCWRRKKGTRNDEESQPILKKSKPYEETRPTTTSKITTEEIIIIAQMFIRSTSFGKLTLVPEIGCRLDKYYFLVEKESSGSKYLMSMVSIGGRCKVTPENKSLIQKLLLSCKHPFILPTENCDYLKDRQLFVTIRSYHKASLKDLIHKAKTSDKYAKKYTTLTGKSLQEKKIAKFGRQILEALIYLKSQKFPFYHLCTSNIILDESGVCRLTDYENDLLGVNVNPRLQQLIQSTIDKIDPVVCAFGAVLYEMTVGYELDSPKLDDLRPTVPGKIKKILQQIYNGDQPMTLEDVSKLPFFAEVQLYSPWNPQNLATEKLEQILEASSTSALEALKNPSTKTPRTERKLTSPKPPPKPKSTSPAVAQAKESTTSGGPPPPPPPPASLPEKKDAGRTQLLGSIESFNSKKLKKAVTNDKSAPQID